MHSRFRRATPSDLWAFTIDATTRPGMTEAKLLVPSTVTTGGRYVGIRVEMVNAVFGPDVQEDILAFIEWRVRQQRETTEDRPARPQLVVLN